MLSMLLVHNARHWSMCLHISNVMLYNILEYILHGIHYKKIHCINTVITLNNVFNMMERKIIFFLKKNDVPTAL